MIKYTVKQLKNSINLFYKTEKNNTMKNLLIFSILALFFTTHIANAQRCDKYNKYCDADLYDYDYSAQSAFAHLYPGDTIPVKTVLYGNKEYHITVCSEYENIPWRIVEPSRKTVKTIIEIRRDTSRVYKMDEYGDYIVDNETGDYIVESTQVTVDTLWNTTRVADEIPIFDNKKAVDWQKKLTKTQRVFIYVTLPMDADPKGACVAVFVGRNQLTKSQFAGKRPTGDSY